MDLSIYDSSPVRGAGPVIGTRCSTRANTNTITNNQPYNHPEPHPPPNHHHRKLKNSRARKSLNFDTIDISKPNNPHDNDTMNHNDNIMNYDTVQAQSPQLNPRSPPPSSSPPPRRSQRLLSKCSHTELLTYPNDDNSNDSGLLIITSNSQHTIKPSSSSNVPFDTLSISSDYGTSSEHSFNSSFQSNSSITSAPINDRKRKYYSTRLHEKKMKLSQQSLNRNLDLSPGYLSDIDEVSHGASQLWDDDDDDDVDLSDLSDPNVNTSPIMTDWDTIITQERLNQLNSLHVNNIIPQVKLLSINGVHLIATNNPEYYQIPQNSMNTINQRIINDHFSHLIQIPITNQRTNNRKYGRHKINQAQIINSPFHITTNSPTNVISSFLLISNLRLSPASDLITPLPLRTKFSHNNPAIISIPLNNIPSIHDQVYLLYSEKKYEELDNSNPIINWRIYDESLVHVNLKDGRVTFETLEFYNFLVVIREKAEMNEKIIRRRTGGKLHIPTIPWISISFPPHSIPTDIITARAKIYLDTEKSLPDLFNSDHQQSNMSTLSLASPIIMLEPHGINFENGQKITIRLPIPDYEEIINYFGEDNAKLFILQSCTSEHEPTNWEILDTQFNIIKSKNMTVVQFEVGHFSFFRVVWDLISASLYETKVGMSNYFSFVSFSMKCQANMSSQANDNRFGLEVTCFRSDKNYPEQSNYRFKVGGSTKPKMVRPGRIFVRLKSQYFVADEGAGEDPSLIKEENDFRGRDFELQYCCKFSDMDKPIETGTFGKVIVKRTTKAGQEEPLFEFNLQKSGHEGEKTPYCLDQNDRWSIVALQELASNMFITDGDNWKMFAKAIGFNKNEINRLIKPSPDPFLTMINVFQHRGGSPDEFVQSIYSVHRELKLQAASPASSRKSKASNSSSGRGSLPNNDKYGTSGGSGRKVICNSDSDTSGTQISQDSLLNGSRKRSSNNNNSISRGSGGDSSSKKYKRRKFTVVVPPPKRKDSSGTEEEEDENGSTGSANNSDESGSGQSDDSDGGGGHGHAGHGPRTRKGHLKSKSVIDNSAQSTSMSSIIYQQDHTPLTQKYMWEISSHIDTITWRPLGRTLGLEESKLINIENSYRNNGFRECAYQTLIAWREKYPKNCNFSNLYLALKKEGLTRVAKKMPDIMINNN